MTNCQVTVNCHYAERTRAWPVATRLYLPREWAADEARRQQAHVPAAVRFQTKAEIALALLDEAKACGVQHRCVTCNADYGDNPHFLNGLEARGEYYLAAVRASFSVTLGRGQASPVLRADAVLTAPPRHDWQTMAWSAGAKAGGGRWHPPSRLVARATPRTEPARGLAVFLE